MRSRQLTALFPSSLRVFQTLDGPVTSIEDLKEWNFDGSSTGQAEGRDSDVFLRPAAIFKDPFRGGNNILVMAETCELALLAP